MKTKITDNFPTNKLVFFIFNVFLMLIGASYIGIGTWLVETFKLEKQKLELIREFYTTMGILMLVVGGLCALMAFIGYILTFWRRLTVLVGYLLMLIIIFLLGIAVGVVGFVYAYNVDGRMDKTITDVLFMSNDYESIQLTDAIQTNFKCCGVNGPHDYSNWITKPNMPSSCCENKSNECKTETDKQYTDGCLFKVRASIFNDMLKSGAVSLAIILPVILGMISVGSLIMETLDQTNKIKYRTSKA